ncbi:hypothetical protein CH267_23250 [Rhodococcus sp. 06-621-2]|nr:hypothetical protein CH267_23250 [Rhodococcus sp. 06-621-2]
MAGVIDAEFRAYLEPVLAKLARKGVLNPDEPKPVHDTDLSTAYPGTTPDGTDSADSADGDGRNEPNPDGDGADEQDCDATSFGTAGSGDPGAGTAAGSGTASAGAGTAAAGSGTASAGSGTASAGSGTASAGSGTASTGSPGPLTLFDPEETAAGAELEARAGRDVRTQGQRNHDAVKAVFRQTLAAGTLGTHRGLPVTAVISMSASDLATASAPNPAAPPGIHQNPSTPDAQGSSTTTTTRRNTSTHQTIPTPRPGPDSPDPRDHRIEHPPVSGTTTTRAAHTHACNNPCLSVESAAPRPSGPRANPPQTDECPQYDDAALPFRGWGRSRIRGSVWRVW